MLKHFILRDERSCASLYAFLKANWQAMAKDGKPLAVQVSEYKQKRNSDQNRYYWQLLRFIADNAWIDGRQYSDEAYHEFYKRKFIGLEELPGGAQVGISTTKLSVSEFADYIRKIEFDADTELGLMLPANPRDLI